MKGLLLFWFLLPAVSIAQRLPVDKQMHIAVGVAIGASVTAIGNPGRAFNRAIVAGFTAGVLKEAYDVKFKGDVDIKDALATAAGAVAGAAVIFVIRKLKRKRK